MTMTKKMELLELHGLEPVIENGRITAGYWFSYRGEWVREVQDFTDMSKRAILRFLGY